MERVGWIDFLRGISMILILAFHTEVYYKEYDVTPYYIYTTNAVILFYFISGYLFYRHEEFKLKNKIKSIINSLVIPYFIFTTIITFLKVLIRQQTIDWQDIAINILSGRASWFIAALIVGESLFSVILWISRGKHLWLSTAAIVCGIIYYIIPFNQHNYWQWQDALMAFVFLYLGYLFHQYQQAFHTINKPLYSSIFLLILILIKVYEYDVDLPMRNIAVENAPLFMMDAIIWLFLVVSIIKYIPRFKMIEWTGQHCIVYYFLAGGCPLLISILLNKAKIPYDGYFHRFLIAFVLVYGLDTILTWLIYRYTPFITGNKSIK